MSVLNRSLFIEKPVECQLVLREKESGELHHNITREQLRRMGLSDSGDAYARFCQMLLRAAGVNSIGALPEGFNVIRYMVECALSYEHDYDYASCDEEVEGNARMNEAVRYLTACVLEHEAGNTYREALEKIAAGTQSAMDFDEAHKLACQALGRTAQ